MEHFYFSNGVDAQLANIKPEGGCYMLYGPQGLGKSAAAQMVSARILERDVSHLETHPDFYLLKPEKEDNSIGMEQLEEMRCFSGLVPAVAKVKVLMIDNASSMTDSAQNACLKLLEEGTANMLVLIVAHTHMLSTIESRCKKIIFAPLTDEVVRQVVPQASSLELALAKGKIGLLKSMPVDYFSEVSSICKAIETGGQKEVFEAFHLMKEKDSNHFFEAWDASLVKALLRVLRENVFLPALLCTQQIGSDSICDTVKVSSHYSPIRLADICERLEKAERVVGNKNTFNKNDFFDLIRFLV